MLTVDELKNKITETGAPILGVPYRNKINATVLNKAFGIGTNNGIYAEYVSDDTSTIYLSQWILPYKNNKELMSALVCVFRHKYDKDIKSEFVFVHCTNKDIIFECPKQLGPSENDCFNKAFGIYKNYFVPFYNDIISSNNAVIRDSLS